MRIPTIQDIVLFINLLDERDHIRQEDPEQAPSAQHGQLVGEGYVPGEDAPGAVDCGTFGDAPDEDASGTKTNKPCIVSMLNT